MVDRHMQHVQPGCMIVSPLRAVQRHAAPAQNVLCAFVVFDSQTHARNYLRADAQTVEIVSPLRHQLSPLLEELGAVVGMAERVLHGVRELRLDDLGNDAQTLGGHRAGHRAEPVGVMSSLP